jgi:hypothetical protein
MMGRTRGLGVVLALGLLVGLLPGAAAAAQGGELDARVAAAVRQLQGSSAKSSEGSAQLSLGRGAGATDGERHYADAGCLNDPQGDVVDFDTGAPVADARADIVRFCADYQRSGLSLFLTTAQFSDPREDPVWAAGSSAWWEIDVDDDGMTDFNVLFVGDSTGIDAFLLNASFSEIICDALPAIAPDGTYIAGQIPGECFGSPAAVSLWSNMLIERSDGVTAFDWAPDGGFAEPLPRTAGQCRGDGTFGAAEPLMFRITCQEGRTSAIKQAIAMSEFSFPDRAAAHVVLARNDEFPDALTGSALGFGIGPLLFTHSNRSVQSGEDPNLLARATRQEILRVLFPAPDLPESQRPVVYILGGPSAVPGGVDAQLRNLGYRPVRLAGSTRFETAELIAAEVRRMTAETAAGFPVPSAAMLATGLNWPDAVAAGQVSAFWGVPIYLTARDSLHPAAERGMRAQRPQWLYVIGGRGVVSDATAGAANRLAIGGPRNPGCPADGAKGCRVFGGERLATAASVGELQKHLFVHYNRELEEYSGQARQVAGRQYAMIVNLRRPPDGYAHVLSASVIAGRFSGAVYLPVEQNDGSGLNRATQVFACQFLRRDPSDNIQTVVVAGGRDLVVDASATQYQRWLRGQGC